MWRNTVERGRPQMNIWCIRIRVPKATNAHTHVVWYSLFFHCNNGCKNEPQCYVERKLRVLFY